MRSKPGRKPLGTDEREGMLGSLLLKVESGDKKILLMFARQNLKMDVEGLAQYDPNLNPYLGKDMQIDEDQLQKAREIVTLCAVNNLHLVESISGK